MKRHIVQFSGGKDSTCMLLMMLEKGMQVDEIIFCDTGKEFPQMYEHIQKVNDYISKLYNKTITVLKSEKSFDYYMFEHVKTRGKNKGKKGYGWANMLIRWCTSNLKRMVADKHLKGVDRIEYIGIARDEEHRHMIIPSYVRHPLYDWNITEAQALKYCYEHGFTWGGLYENFKRVSCWCCPLKSLPELRTLYHKYPELWQQLKDMDNRAYNQFRADYSVQQLEEKFKKEDAKLDK